MLAGETLRPRPHRAAPIWLASVRRSSTPVYLPLVEEPSARPALRPDYERYMANVRRWRPRLSRLGSPPNGRGPFRGPLRQRVFKPDSVGRDHPSRRAWARRGFRPAAYLDLAGPGHRSCLALHRAGFAWPPRHRDAGALLPHHFTFACARLLARHRPCVSVALSRGFPRVGVTHRLALWCPDFPREFNLPRPHVSPQGRLDCRPRPEARSQTAAESSTRSSSQPGRARIARRRPGTPRAPEPARSAQVPRISVLERDAAPGRGGSNSRGPAAPPRRGSREQRALCVSRRRAHRQTFLKRRPRGRAPGVLGVRIGL